MDSDGKLSGSFRFVIKVFVIDIAGCLDFFCNYFYQLCIICMNSFVLPNSFLPHKKYFTRCRKVIIHF